MKSHTTSRLFHVLCGMAVMLALAAGITAVPVSVSAAANGIYIAAATPHYKHPATGKIEDAGGEGSSVLGQSMTESATYKKALVEVDSAGNTYITVRLQLMDNIQNPQFQVDGTPVSASLMQEDYTNNTADYRVKVNSENSIIRCNMYVIPMGRDVIFYITVSNLQSGSDDFITSVKVEQSRQPDPVQAQTPADPQTQNQAQAPAGSQTQNQMRSADPQQPSATAAQQTENPGNAQAASAAKQPDLAGSSETETADPQISDTESPVSSGESLSVSTSGETEKSQKDTTGHGLQEFDKEGNKVDGSETKNVQKTGGSSTAVWWIAGSIILIAAAGGCVWYFCIFKKKK